MLTRVAGQERERELWRERTHRGRREAALGGQGRVHLAVRGVGRLAPPGQAHQHLRALGGTRKGEARGRGCKEAQACARTGRARTVPRSAGYRPDTSERLHDLIPRQIVAHHQQVAPGGPGPECRLIAETRLGVSAFRGSHGRLLASVWFTLAQFEGKFWAHENPIFLTG